MRFVGKLFLISALIMSLSACKTSSSTSSVNQAESFFNSQQYDKSISAYKKAINTSPDNANIKMGLIKALSTSAVSLYEEVETRPIEDLDSRVQLLEKANSQREEALSVLTKVEQLKPVNPQINAPYARPTQLLLPYDNSMDYSAQVKLYKETLAKHEQLSSKKLKEEMSNRDSIFSEINAVVAKTNQSPDGPIVAYNAFKPYNKYVQYVDKAKADQKNLISNAINYYEAKGLKALSNNQFEIASAHFKNAEKVKPNSNQAKAGLLAVGVKKQINANDQLAAYSGLNTLYQVLPTSTFYSKHMPTVRNQIVNGYLTEASKLAKTDSIQDKAKAFDLYFKAKPIAKPSPPLIGKVTDAISALQDRIGIELTARAVVLNKQDPYAYPAVVSALLSNAYSFSESAPMAYKQTARKANAIVPNQQGLSILLSTDGKIAQEKASFSNWLKEQFSKQLESENVSQLTVIDPQDLQTQVAELSTSNVFSETPIPFESAELIFLLDLTKHDIQESGRDRATYKQSQFVSGQKMVDNPEYKKAEIAKDEAKTNLIKVEALEKQAFDQCKALNAQGYAIDCSYGSLDLDAAKNTVTSTEQAFLKTSKQIEEKTTSDYKYEEYTIRVKGEIKAELSAYDRRSKNTFNLKPITLTVDKNGQLRNGVKENDVTGIKNGEDGLPRVGEETYELEKQLLDHVVNEVTEFRKAHDWQRFCLQAEALNKSGRTHAAANASIQCVAKASKDNNSEYIATANESIQKYMGFTNNQVKKYGRNSNSPSFNSTPDSSNGNASLSAQEKQTALKSSTLSFANQSKKPFNFKQLVRNQIKTEESKARRLNAKKPKHISTPATVVTTPETATAPVTATPKKKIIKKTEQAKSVSRAPMSVPKQTHQQPASTKTVVKQVEEPKEQTPPTVINEEEGQEFGFDFDIVEPVDL